jgi:hypothetical protein
VAVNYSLWPILLFANMNFAKNNMGRRGYLKYGILAFEKLSKLGLFYQYMFKCGIDFKENADIKFDTFYPYKC